MVTKKEFLRKAKEWATTFNAIGFTGKEPNASNITFGTAIQENSDTQESIVKLGAYLKTVVEKAAAHYNLTLKTETF